MRTTAKHPVVGYSWTIGGVRHAVQTKGPEFERLHPRGRAGRWISRLPFSADDSAGGGADPGDRFAAWGARAARIRDFADRYPSADDLFDLGDSTALERTVALVLANVQWPHGAGIDVEGAAMAGRQLVFDVSITMPGGLDLIEAYREILVRPATGNLHAFNDSLKVRADHRGEGWARQFNRVLEDWFIASGVERTYLLTDSVGGYAWARAGYDWDPDRYPDDDTLIHEIETILNRIEAQATAHGATAARPEIAALLGRYRRSLNGPRYAYPTPFELSRIGWFPGAREWAGKDGMIGASWYGAKDLIPPPQQETKQMNHQTAAAQAAADRQARLAALAELHDQMLAGAPGTDLGTDTNVPADAEADFQRAAAEVFPLT